MKNPASVKMTRRKWLLASAAALTGCGGGGVNLGSALPGTGGTGIGVQGTITGFGSVIVNGTKFDDQSAGIYLDGSLASSADLRIGLVANISGSLDAGAANGTASRIDVWSVASGLLHVVDLTGTTFQLMGMQFVTDLSTVFEGIAGIASIASDTTISVWAIQTSADAHQWLATRIKAHTTATNQVVTTGLFNATASTFNGMLLGGIALTGFAEGELIRVAGTLDITTNTLSVIGFTAIGADDLLPLTGKVELEGVVTRVTDSNHFALGTVPIDATTADRGSDTQSISAGTFLEVTGAMQGGILVASKLEIQDSSSAMQVDISGTVETFASVSDFVVRGQRCDASNAGIQSGSLANLRVDAKVRVIGLTESDDVLRVLSLTIDVP